MGEKRFLPGREFPGLLGELKDAGYGLIGPRVRDGAIVYDRLDDADTMPIGLRTRQAPGRYRLEAAGDTRRFAWANGPQALKPLVFAPEERLWRVERGEAGLRFVETLPEPQRRAVVGVRPCDLAALALQDAHFIGRFPESHYARRREGLFLVAVNCSHPAETCFCASTGDGPAASGGFDLLLDELDDGFIVEAGSDAGRAVLEALALAAPHAEQVEQAGAQVKLAADTQTRALPSRNLAEALFANLDHPRWGAVAERCLSCANCTQVCPTCFCHNYSDEPALDGISSENLRRWDSCFTEGHSYIHGWVLRPDTAKRYRQWMTHKLGSWHEQFGRSGCVGCGRCIAWCPAGIDFTEEAAAVIGGGAES